MKPVHVGEPVLERTKGRVRLGDVCTGDEVLTHRGRFRRVSAVHEQGVLPLLRVATLDGHAARAAPDHPFLTPRGWVAAGELRPGDAAVIVEPGQAARGDSIVSIEPAGEGECRCLTVEEDCSFTVSDIAVHNSLTTCVFWPAWVWLHQPASRWLFAAYAQTLSTRDSVKMRRLIESPWYRSLWGDRFTLTSDQNAKERYENDKTGVRLATSVEGTNTGEGGNFIVVDDPHNAKEALSEAKRQGAVDWWSNVMSTRRRPPKTGGRVIVMQRLHELDLSGHVLRQGGWEHFCMPCEFERSHPFVSVLDWRRKPGELLWPEMFDAGEVAKVKRELSSSYAIAGQLQQRPAPEGGGILKREWWRTWPGDHFPNLQGVYIYADTAYGASSTADHSACTVWGIFQNDTTISDEDRYGEGIKASRRGVETASFGVPVRYELMDGEPPDPTTGLLLLYAWRENLKFNELVDKLEHTATKFRCDRLTIEAKASGISVGQELRRRCPEMPVRLKQPPPGDKVARAYAVQGIFEAGMVYAPDTSDPERYKRDWAGMVIDECASFPAGRYKDIVDTVSHALHDMRQMGVALYEHEQPDPWEAVKRERREALY